MGKLTVGEYTYFAEPPVLKGSMNNVTIGKFSSIGAHVTFDCGWSHNTENISTFPFHTLGWADNNNVCRGDISIGNDVWIGDDCIIMSGVSIGDGCVIGARSIITKDIFSYKTVVGHNREVKDRVSLFDKVRLKEMEWWDWPIDHIQRVAPILHSNDIDKLYDYFIHFVLPG